LKIHTFWGYAEVAVIVLAHGGKKPLYRMTSKAVDASFLWGRTQNRLVFKCGKFSVQGLELCVEKVIVGAVRHGLTFKYQITVKDWKSTERKARIAATLEKLRMPGHI
jgi:hypothetical protein